MALVSEALLPYLEGIHDAVRPSRYMLEKGSYTIGRDPLVCQIVVAQEVISRLHARIERRGHRYIVIDNLSHNGTYVNGRRIIEPCVLNSGDLLGLGSKTPLFQFVDYHSVHIPVPRYNGHLEHDQLTMMFEL